MTVFKLPKVIKDKIENKISELFDGIKGKFLGPSGSDKSLVFNFKRSTSLPGMYEEAVKEEGALPSIETLSTVIDTSKKYIDALKLKTVNTVINDLETHLGQGDSTAVSIEQTLTDSWENITSQMERIIATETQGTKSIGVLEGITKMNETIGIEDPVVFFACPMDTLTCKECQRLHFMPNLITPRCWYLSELKSGYAKKGDPTPSTLGQHPHCRGTLTTLMPGFGFDGAGSVTYIQSGYSEIRKQRNL